MRLNKTTSMYYISVLKSNICKTVFYDVLVFRHICTLISIAKQIKIQHLQLINWLHGFFDEFTNFAKCSFLVFFFLDNGGLWRLTLLSIIFQHMAVSSIGGGNQSIRRKSLICHKSLTNFIT
jgi:hypothetical protein